MNTLGGETIMAWWVDLVSSSKCYLLESLTRIELATLRVEI